MSYTINSIGIEYAVCGIDLLSYGIFVTLFVDDDTDLIEGEFEGKW